MNDRESSETASRLVLSRGGVVAALAAFFELAGTAASEATAAPPVVAAPGAEAPAGATARESRDPASG
jgi:hypothetical protein